MGYIQAISAVLAVPGTLDSLCKLWERIMSLRDNPSQVVEDPARRSLRSIEERCSDGEREARGILSERHRERISAMFRKIETILSDSSATERLTSGMTELLSDYCSEAEHSLRQAMRTQPISRANDKNIEDIKMKLLRDFRVPQRTGIYSDGMPPDFKEDDREDDRFSKLDGELCFVEYFPFGTDTSESERIKKRICWMMFLIKEIGCLDLAEPVRVYKIGGRRRPGFYTYSRVRTAVGKLYTLDSRISELKNKRRVLNALCRAVEEIHSETILHKNICPHIILVDDEDNAWLAGFTSSRINEQQSYRIQRNEEEEKRFKMVYYASTDDPSMHIHTFQCDIYSLGITMLEIALKMCFMEKKDVVTSRADILRLLGEKNGRLKDLISRCLADEARARPCADEIRLEIDGMEDDDFYARFDSPEEIRLSIRE